MTERDTGDQIINLLSKLRLVGAALFGVTISACVYVLAYMYVHRNQSAVGNDNYIAVIAVQWDIYLPPMLLVLERAVINVYHTRKAKCKYT